MNVNDRGVHCEPRTHRKETCYDLLHKEAFNEDALNISGYEWCGETDMQPFSTECECVLDVITVKLISATSQARRQ
jgi:hypothetical protein